MLPLLSLHALAAQRGDGLRPELKALLERHARRESGLSATIEAVEAEPLEVHEQAQDQVQEQAQERTQQPTSADFPPQNAS
jgi:hypothetical protein